eukprot:1234590-Amphidinium_carterae.1
MPSLSPLLTALVVCSSVHCDSQPRLRFKVAPKLKSKLRSLLPPSCSRCYLKVAAAVTLVWLELPVKLAPSSSKLEAHAA